MTLANAVYYPSWQAYKGQTPSCIQADAVTHVFYAFLRLNDESDGTINHLDDFCDLKKDIDGYEGCLAALAALKQRNPHVKTIISVGGGSGSGAFPALAGNPEARSTLARELVDFCDRHCFDGVDIDWEHPETPEDGANFLLLMQDLRQAMPEDRYILTTALPTGEYCLKNIDLAKLGNTVTFLNLMAYDFSGAWSKTAGHHAQLRSRDLGEPYPQEKSVTRGVEYVLSHGFPAPKILVGVPAYARFFPSARGPTEEFMQGGEMEYNTLPEEWITQADVDEKLGTASVVDEKGGNGFVSFDIPQTVAIKARYVKENMLGGLFYWTAAGDRDDELSLVASGYDELRTGGGGEASQARGGADDTV